MKSRFASLFRSAALASLFLTAAATAVTVITGGAPLVLNSLNGDLPQIGTVFDLEISAIPSGSPFGIMVIGFTGYDPGFDLTAYGLPGCAQHVSVDDMFIYPITSSPTRSVAKSKSPLKANSPRRRLNLGPCFVPVLWPRRARA